MKNSILSIATACIAFASASAMAQEENLAAVQVPGAAVVPQTAPAVSQPIVPTIPRGEVEYYEREADLVAQLRLLDLQVEIKDRQQKLLGTDDARPTGPGSATDSVVVSRTTLPGAPAGAVAAPARPSSDLGFSVVSIWGADDALEAQVLSHGLRISVREGDLLPGGWTVQRVARTGLLLSKGKTQRTVMIGG